MENIKRVKKLTISALVIALYTVIMTLTSSFAFGAIQIRIATALYSLSYIFPFLVLPLGLANVISNMCLGGLGVYDIVGGGIVGILTAFIILKIREKNINYRFISVPIILVPGLIVPLWLTTITGIPYKVLAISLSLGQVIPSIVGVIIIKYLRERV